MWVYFNKYGQVRKQLDHGTPFRQGAVGNKIVAVFDGGIVSANREATISFRKPSGEIVENTYAMDYVSDIEFSLLPGEQNVYPFADGENYPAYVFTVNDSSIFSETGIYQTTIKVYYGTDSETEAGNILVVGLLSINVELSVYPEEYVLDTTEFDILVSMIANKMSKSGGIITVPHINQADFSEYPEGQIVYGVDTESLYELNLNKDPVFIAKISDINNKLDVINGILVVENIGSLSPSSYNEGQTFYNKANGLFYRVVSGEFQQEDVLPNKLNKSPLGSILYGNDENSIPTTYTVRDIADQIEGIILSDYYTKVESDGRYVQKTSEPGIVYATDQNGDDTDQMLWAYDNGGYTFAVRYAGGKLSVGTPQYDNDAATKKYVDDLHQAAMEVAGGKTKTYVISYQTTAPTTDAQARLLKMPDGTHFESYQEFLGYVYDEYEPILANPYFESQDLYFDADDGWYIITEDGTVYSWNDIYDTFNTGDNIYVSETVDSNGDVLPDRWWYRENLQFMALETQKVDLSGYVDLTTNQTIGGNKTFSNAITISGGDGFVLSTSGYSGILGLGVVNTLQFDSGALWTNVANFDLGKTGHYWRDLYLSRNITDGTYSATFANIFGALFNTVFSLITELKFGRINVGSRNADTTFTLETPPHFNTTPEYKGEITNSAVSSITLTFTGVSKILCNDENVTITNATNSTMVLPAGTTIEFSIVNGKMVAINWSAN